MPRRGQQAYRRKKQQEQDRAHAAAAVDSAPSFLEATSSSSSTSAMQDVATNNDDEPQPRTIAGQALPVAILPDDFEGDASDGATYLALANRETSKLPFYKRVQPPAHLVNTVKAPEDTKQERHPALPRESWESLYAAHFKAYREHLRSLPEGTPDPNLPKPRDAAGWLGYIQGVPLKSKRREERALEDDDDGDEDEQAEDAEEDRASAAMDLDEEAAVNGPEDDAEEEEAMNNDPPKLVPREPLLSVLRTLDTPSILMIIRHLTFYITATLDSISDWEAEGPSDPLPAYYARWAFALLALIDEHLTSDEISVLRDFARAAAAAASWRWTTAVTKKDLSPTPITEGFYGDGAQVPSDKWVLGAKWKSVRDARPRSEPSPRPNDTSLDADLASAWMCAYAVIAGWAQWDLLEDFERSFSKLPRP